MKMADWGVPTLKGENCHAGAGLGAQPYHLMVAVFYDNRHGLVCWSSSQARSSHQRWTFAGGGDGRTHERNKTPKRSAEVMSEMIRQSDPSTMKKAWLRKL